MKRVVPLVAMLLLIGSGSLFAQGVRVQINGSQSFLLNETNGLYFHNDSLTVDEYSYALEDIQMITFQATSGIADIKDIKLLELAPNPASDRVILRGIGNEPQMMTLYSTVGVKLMEQVVEEGTVVNISHLPEGVYVLRCGDRVAKMVKQM